MGEWALTNSVPLISDTSASTLDTPKLSAVSRGTSLQSSHVRKRARTL